MANLCEQYLGNNGLYTGTWLCRDAVSGSHRTALAAEWRRSKGFFKKRVVVHGRTSYWLQVPADAEARKWLVTLADTCPYPRRET